MNAQMFNIFVFQWTVHGFTSLTPFHEKKLTFVRGKKNWCITKETTTVFSTPEKKFTISKNVVVNKNHIYESTKKDEFSFFLWNLIDDSKLNIK